MADKLALHGGEKVRTKPFSSISDASGRLIGEEEKRLVLEVLDSAKLNRNTGTKVREFEERFARYYGVKHAIASTSGTSALHVAVAALDLEPGDEIVTTTITDMGSLIGILMQNLVPVFADVDRRTGNVTAETIEKVLSPKTRAIMPIHLFGQPCDMDPILDLARSRGLAVIEDASQAHGAKHRGRLVGTMGDLGCFSFQQSKQMTTGDGGMTITNDDRLAERARLFTDKAWPRDSGRGHLFLAMNYRMIELAGAVGIAQLTKLDTILGRRRASAEVLTEELKRVPSVNPPFRYPDIVHSWWIYSMTIDEARLGVTPREFADALRAEGIPFGAGYIPNPMFDYPVIKERRTYGTSGIPWTLSQARRDIAYRDEDVPETLWFLGHTINMSWNEGITDADARDIARGVAKVAAWFRKHPGGGTH